MDIASFVSAMCFAGMSAIAYRRYCIIKNSNNDDLVELFDEDFEDDEECPLLVFDNEGNYYYVMKE